MIILQTVASHAWELTSFDVKAAFLQGKTQDGRIIGLDPVPETRKAMNMNDQEVGRLNKSAYGLIDAPYLWYQTLSSELINLGMEVRPFDPCTFVLRDKNDNNRLAGILGIHVDDGICGGNEQFQQVLNQREFKYKFGSKKVGSFRLTGIDLTQQGDHSIVLS